MRVTQIARVFVLGMTAIAGRAQQTGNQDQTRNEKTVADAKSPEAALRRPQSPPDSITENTVMISGQKIEYRAIAGTITVGSTDAYDALIGSDGQLLPDAVVNPTDPAKPEEAQARARMFYTAYFRKGASAGSRPVMFLYNGGPGSSTMWLHMGSFGPRRVAIPDTEHKTAAPYAIVDNQYSLLDVTDLVFIDAPGAGLSRIQGKDKEKAFWGVDQDAHAFERFIRRFLTKYERWNSPKYLFGESYGTPRSAVLSALLKNVDLNGIVLLSAILNFDNSVDGPRWNPGVDQPYASGVADLCGHGFLPSQATGTATRPRAISSGSGELCARRVLDRSSGRIAAGGGTATERSRKTASIHRTASRLYSEIEPAGGWRRLLQEPAGSRRHHDGEIDTRYRGPDLNRLSEEAEYDPQASAISAAYTTAINDYLRRELKFGKDETYKPNAYEDIGSLWDFRHKAPGGPADNQGFGSATNTMPDLAFTMKSNPKMRVMLAGGYFDLATPYFEGIFEMHHLPIPQSLQQNISYKYYESGHMVYLNEGVLRQFKADVAQFVRDTESGK